VHQAYTTTTCYLSTDPAQVHTVLFISRETYKAMDSKTMRG